jgi:3-deoxy-D-manno-octulosonate 8-phosphate phosphatase (KDO 8-P phosphatase)
MRETEAEQEERFKALGGVFLTPSTLIASRLKGIRAFVFDWDGVFNAGVKGAGLTSSFSEPDSMGANLLRYAFWRESGSMPICAIVSGEENDTAERFAEREHFHCVYLGIKNKNDAVNSICSDYRLAAREIAFLFDDVNDLGAAANCGVRVLVRRDASPLLQDFIAMNSLCDYITANEVGRYPVRETAELFMGLIGAFDIAVASRMATDDDYRAYFSERQAIETERKRLE